jgi:hypothetical protein
MRLQKSFKVVVLAAALAAPGLTGCRVVCREPGCPIFRPSDRDEGAARDFPPNLSVDELPRRGGMEVP